MPHPVKKIYKAGSPGANRKEQNLTLSALQKKISAAGTNALHVRKNHNEQGMLGWKGF